MDMDSESNLGESSRSSTRRILCDGLVVNNSSLHALSHSCALCHRILSSDNETGDLEAISVCGDCKFLLLEDLETTSPDVYPRRTRVSRRRYDSSESIESMFSQQFSQMINLARQSQSTVLERDSHPVDGDGAARIVRRTSSQTTPSGSGRWRRVFSDTESDGFDSMYGESESNASFRRYRGVNGEADTIIYSAYGGDSDASVDGQSFLENENFGHLNGESDLDSDTDIDPMNAGLYQWNSEDEEEDDLENDSEWEEADTERNTLESLRAGAQAYGSSMSNGTDVYIILRPEVVGTFSRRRRDRIQAHAADFLTNFEESVAQNYVGDFGDNLNARGFGDLLEHLAETESSRRGAPPASVSFVNIMPRITINEENLDGMACAICKDSFTIGTVVNQLPCFHLYHPSCILPWLSARNTCPLCRFELPTDDKDYETRKWNMINENETFHIHQPELNDDSSLDATYDVVVDEPSQIDNSGEQREAVNPDSARENVARDSPRNRWFFLSAAAAPFHIQQPELNDNSSLDATYDVVVDEPSQIDNSGEQREAVNPDSARENVARDSPRNRWFFLAAAAAPLVSMVGISLFLWFGNPSVNRICRHGHLPYRRENSQRRWWSFF